MKKVSFVFAPFAAPFMPPLGLPLLSSFLNKYGIYSEIYDLNIELYNRFLEANTVRSALEGLTNRYRWLKNRSHLTSAEATEYLDILPIVLVRCQLQRDLTKSLQLYHRRRAPSDRRDLFHSSQIIAYALRAVAQYLGHLNAHPRNPYFLIHPQDYPEIQTWNRWRPHVEWYALRLQEAVHDADIVGFSLCYPSQLPMTLLGASLVRKIDPSIRIVMGGPFSTSIVKRVTNNVPKGFLKNYTDLFDAIIIKDGEHPLLEFIEATRNGRTPVHPSIIVSPEFAKPVGDKNTLEPSPPTQTPAFEKLPLNLYLSPCLTLPMLTSRHCYWGKCTFCAHSIGYDHFHRYDAEDILSQLIRLEKTFGKISIYFMDECLPPTNAFQIARGLRDARSGIRWAADMRFERSLTRDRLKELYDGGCRYIAFGLESVNERVNRIMRKGTSKSQISRIIDNCYDIGIHTCLMFFCGFPTETRDEAYETVQFILERVEKVSAVGMSHFTLCPGTEIYEHANDYGIYDISEDGEFQINAGMNRDESREFRIWAGEQFSKKVYEGHELYHRLFYTMELADLHIPNTSPYPLRITELSRVMDCWRETCVSNGHDLVIWQDLGIDSVPFAIEDYREGEVLMPRKDRLHAIVAFNLNHPLGQLCFMKPDVWRVLSNEEALKRYLTKPRIKDYFIDEGIVRYG